MIAGLPAAGEPEDARERAMLHLERFAFTGLMERFDESVLLLARRFGWRNVFYARVNTNRRRPTYADTPARLRAAIEERSADDMALYRFAAERFEAMRAAAPIPPYVLRGYAAVNQLLTVGASLRRQGELLSQRLRHAPARTRD